MITRDELTDLLRADVNSVGSQRALAKRWEVSPSYVTDLLRGLRDPGAKILDAMGLERIVMYQSTSDENVEYRAIPLPTLLLAERLAAIIPTCTTVEAVIALAVAKLAEKTDD